MRFVLIAAAAGGFGLGASMTLPGGNWLFGGIEGAAEMLLSVVVYCAWRAFKNR